MMENYLSWLPEITLLRKRWRVLKDNPERAAEDMTETQEIFTIAFLQDYSRHEIDLLSRVVRSPKMLAGHGKTMSRLCQEGFVTYTLVGPYADGGMRKQ